MIRPVHISSREKQPTPRKGTETHRTLQLTLPITETTHTPQGDGNDISGNYERPCAETTHTPQGDGNLDGIEPVADLGRNNPHPARGRKTICVYIAEIVGETIHIPGRGQLTKKERETP